MKLDLLNQQQIQELIEIIDQQNTIFIAQHIGWDVLLPNDQQKLIDLGFSEDNIAQLNYSELAFKFGMLSEVAKERAKHFKYKDFKKFVKSGKYVPLSSVELAVLNNVQSHLYSDIKGLGNKIQGDINNILIEVDKKQRSQYESILRGEITQAVSNRETVKDVVSRLGHATGDWSRDFGRIADYVLHDAYDRGRAVSIKKYTDEEDPSVYKDVYDGACKHCIGLYRNKDGSPKVFNLSQLESNGSNIGRKAVDWLPVLGSTHPHCRCSINYVPKDSQWNYKNNSFELKRTKRKVNRKSKITLKIGDDTIKI